MLAWLTPAQGSAMILGLTTATFTIVHVIISLVGIIAGFVAIYGFLKNERLDGWNALFLATTVLTSASGFLFPRTAVTPAQIVGVMSLVLLVIAIVARYPLHLSGAWGWIYVVTALLAQYFNFAVLIIQSFQKIGPLNALAPTQSEPPFLIAQGATLIAFLVVGLVAVRNVRRTGLT